MIGVDTNVLARLFVTDNERQHKVAVRFFSARSTDDPVFVSLVVQAELVWLLGRTMRFPHERIVAVLGGMLSSPDFVVEQRELLEGALQSMTAQRVDLADFLIAGISNKAGCSTTVTFDRPAAANVPGMELLK